MKRKKKSTHYVKDVVLKHFATNGLPACYAEFQFHPKRKWRFDFAFPMHELAIEVQGGLFMQGRHNRGAALLLEHEKLNEAAAHGWRLVFCQPIDLGTIEMIHLLRRCIQA